uniref:Uncharacterized protein n=1 Tax=Rhizophora mucronata TaxID=61149 RepID=A0A2P2Q771_RHIMU
MAMLTQASCFLGYAEICNDANVRR